jgi:hypothetical protein
LLLADAKGSVGTLFPRTPHAFRIRQSRLVLATGINAGVGGYPDDHSPTKTGSIALRKTGRCAIIPNKRKSAHMLVFEAGSGDSPGLTGPNGSMLAVLRETMISYTRIEMLDPNEC